MNILAAAGLVLLWLGGDVHLGEKAQALFAAPPDLQGAGIINLEGPVCQGAPPPRPGLCNGAAALRALPVAGVRVAGIANNHQDDLGPGGPARTAQALSAAGVLPAGRSPALLKVGGLRVVITAHDLLRGAPPSLLDELCAARQQGDVLVATFHVTGPPSYLPRPELVTAVDAALRAGAQVIAAHGSHSLARVERRGGAVIAWGLGNLAFACDCTDEPDAILLQVALSRSGPGPARVVPIQAGLSGRPARVLAEPGPIYDLLKALGSKLDGQGTF